MLLRKRTIAHLLVASIALISLVFLSVGSALHGFTLWTIPFALSDLAIIVLLLQSLVVQPREIDDSWTMFLVATGATLASPLIGVVANAFPVTRIQWLVDVATWGNLVTVPIYLVAVISLGKSLTVLPEANCLKTTGIYGISRHPLYAFYIYWAFLQIFIFQSLAVCIVALCQIAGMLIRARAEEQVLERNFPEYAGYRARVGWFTIPRSRQTYALWVDRCKAQLASAGGRALRR